MSWSTAATSIDPAKFDDSMAAILDAYRTQLSASDYELDPAADEQIGTALAAAKAIVDSGHLGAGLVNVSLSGHANPEHKPVKGCANDVITVSVSSAAPQPTS